MNPSNSQSYERVQQDMPPPGGYREFNWRRTYPKAIFKAKIVLPTVASLAIAGYYQGHMQRKQLMTDKFYDVDVINAVEPFLISERDRYWLSIMRKNRDIENELMKDVPGWKTGTWFGEPVYFTLGDRWFDPWYLEVIAHSDFQLLREENEFKHRVGYPGPHWYDKYIKWPRITERIW